jgi:hypothetical protein
VTAAFPYGQTDPVKHLGTSRTPTRAPLVHFSKHTARILCVPNAALMSGAPSLRPFRPDTLTFALCTYQMESFLIP